MDWRMVSVCFSIFQCIFMAVFFIVIKFNDMKHLEDDLKSLTKDFHDYELKNDERHMQNLDALKELSNKVSNLSGQWEGFNRK